ncbi:MAG: glycosyltransferase [Longimicrobiales bacterium]
MKKVLIVIESLARGGAERLLVTTLTHLDRRRFDVTVVSLFGPNPLADEIRGLGIEVLEYGLAGPRDLIRAVFRLRRTIRERHVDVVHTHLFSANVAGRVAALGSAAVITTLHNPDYGQEGPPSGVGLRRLIDGATAHLCRPSYLAVSEDVKSDYLRHLSLSEVQVLHNYVDLASFQCDLDSVNRSQARGVLGVSDEDFLVLHVGRLHVQKGHDTLLRAFSWLVRDRPQCRLVLAGEGPLRNAIEASVRALGLESQVQLLGGVADTASLYVAADVFVFPSRYEVFGMSLLEAMGAGLPSVVSGVGGILEVTSMESSVVVPPDDAEALCAGLRLLEGDSDRRRALAEFGRRRAMEFDVSVWLPELERLYAVA